jgi:Zn-dependent protease
MGMVGEISAAALAVILAITLHEAAHGYAAKWLGDDTAARMGRLSLNPIRHVDPVGTLLVPGILLVGQLATIGSVQGMFGWAKPVPVNIWRLRDPRWGMVLVAAAGPAINFGLAWGFAVLAHGLEAGADSLPQDVVDWLIRFILLSMLSNVVLALFNLIPIPPLDGGRILVGILPAPAARAVAQLERAGLFIVLGLVFILPMAVPGLDPVRWLVDGLARPILRAIWLLSGHGGMG